MIVPRVNLDDARLFMAGAPSGVGVIAFGVLFVALMVLPLLPYRIRRILCICLPCGCLSWILCPMLPERVLLVLCVVRSP